MGVNNFLYLVFSISIVFLFLEKEQVIVKINNEEKPTVSFYDSVMYDITTTNINQMIQSSEAYLYKTREELVNGLIVTKEDKRSPKDTGVNIIKADYLIKMTDNIYLDGDVNLQLSNGIDLKTEQLEYNTKTQIARNSITFNMTQGESNFVGDHLYLDVKQNHITAKNAKIKIKVLDDEK